MTTEAIAKIKNSYRLVPGDEAELEYWKSKGYSGKLLPNNKMSASFVNIWDAGRELVQPGNFISQAQAYVHYVYVCSNINANSIAGTPWKLYLKKKRGIGTESWVKTKAVSRLQKKYLETKPHIKALTRSSADIEEVTEHPFIDLLTNVNPFMEQYSLFETTQIFLELTGNAFWYVIKNRLGVPAEIWVVPSQWMRIIPSKTDFVGGYMYRATTANVRFDPDEILHFKMANPNSMYYGVSPLAAVSKIYSSIQSMMDYNNALFTNMGRPEGMLVSKEGLAPEIVDKMRNEWRILYGGTRNAGKVAILQGGLEYKPITMPPKDMSYESGMTTARNLIANAYGVPLSKLEHNRTLRGNGQTGSADYEKDTVMPRLARLEQTINSNLLPVYDENLFMAFDNPVGDDEQMRISQISAFISSGYMTRNELRKQDGLEPLPPEQGDIVPPFQGAPAVNAEDQVVGTPPSGGAKPGKTPAINAPTGPVAKPQSKKSVEKKLSKKTKLAIAKKWVANAQKREAAMKKIVKPLLAAQIKSAVAKIKRKEFIGATTKAAPKDGIGKVKGEWVKGFKVKLADNYNEAAHLAADEANSDFSLGVSFNLYEPLLENALDERLNNTAIGVADTTAEAIYGQLDEGLKAGESIPELAARIEDAFGDEYADGRAETIARTENIAVSSMAHNETYALAGIEQHEWIATEDDRTRGLNPKDEYDHVVMDGKKADVGGQFECGPENDNITTEGPGLSGVAGFDINCRCATMPVVESLED